MAEEVYKAVVGSGKHRARLKVVLLLMIVILVVAGLGIGAYALLHKPPKTTPVTAKTQPPHQDVKNGQKVTGQAAINNTVLNTHDYAALGNYLTDPAGNALYTYGKDANGVSNCTGDCLSTWPIYKATSTTGLPAGVGTITRTDTKETQYTYKGKPLYYYSGDSTGNVTADGLNDFHVAKP